jgi:hypothetical protein
MTATTINTIKIRLAEVARTVTGVKRAYSEAPQSLPESDLPVFIPFVGAVTAFGKLGDEMGEETRQFLCRLYVKPMLAGYDGEAEKAVEPFLTSLRDVFISHPTLGLGTALSQIPWVEEITWQGDGGIVKLPFAGSDYLGAEFRLSARLLVQIGIAAYE